MGNFSGQPGVRSPRVHHPLLNLSEMPTWYPDLDPAKEISCPGCLGGMLHHRPRPSDLPGQEVHSDGGCCGGWPVCGQCG